MGCAKIRIVTVSLETKILKLYESKTGNLSAAMARKLSIAVAGYAGKTDPDDANVEDLLSYYPARYEDRSNLIQIDQLYDGLEASVELYVRVAGAIQVGKHRGPKQPTLFIFEISGGDRERTRKPVVVMWFISGRNAKPIIEFYSKRFIRGVRVIAHGKWEWDGRRNTFLLKVQKPELLEVLPPDGDPDSFGLLKIDAKSITTSPAEILSETDEVEQDRETPEFSNDPTARRVPSIAN